MVSFKSSHFAMAAKLACISVGEPPLFFTTNSRGGDEAQSLKSLAFCVKFPYRFN